MENKKTIDYWRQLDICSPSKLTKPITIIGAGATGSYVAWLVAKMGCSDITVYDHDWIENYNPPNQMYGLEDIVIDEDDGKKVKKVFALRRIIESATDIIIKAIPERFTDQYIPGGIVYLLTDTMKSRKTIWDSSIKYKLHIDLLIETRMGPDSGRIYTIRPMMPKHVSSYEKTLYSDEEAEENACTRQAIAPTVATIAGIATSVMIEFLNGKPVDNNEIIISLNPPMIITRKF